jgi:hypothetical protein
MKAIRAGVAFATLVALPLFAQSHSKERSDAGAYPDKDRQLRIDHRGFDGSAKPQSDHAESRLDKEWPGSSAPGLCPDYHGSNGG